MTTVFQENISGFLPRIALSDKSAARECVDFYGAMIWTLAKQSTNSNEAAEEAVQKIFVDIWKNAAFCDLTISNEEVWIALIARRRLANYSAEHIFPTDSAITASANQNYPACANKTALC